MNKTLTILVTVCLLAISCRKAVDAPPAAEYPKLRSTSSVSAPLESKFLVNGEEVILQMVMEPALVCQSYRNGETPKPCHIFIDFTCTLSKAINGYVTVEVQKTNREEAEDGKLEGAGTGDGIAFNIAPNTTKFTFRSSFENNNNLTVAENKFRIEKVGFYKKVD